MDESVCKSCFECKSYIGSVGEKGFCKLYDHETTSPEIACPRFLKKEKITIPDVQPEVKKQSETRLRIVNVLMVGAFLASTVLTILGFIFALYFGISVAVNDYIPGVLKLMTVFVLFVLVLFGTYILFTLGKKYLWVRFLEIIIAIAAVAVILMKYETIWSSLTVSIAKFIEIIYGSYF